MGKQMAQAYLGGLATSQLGRRPPECLCTSSQGQEAFGRPDVGMCTKLCEDGPVRETVDALNHLVQQGTYVPATLFYRVLKRCIAHKDLALGRLIHALSVKCGYEGDAFLATHLIVLYASHKWLDEAMRVFTKVSTPSSNNWATIILAYVRQGQAAEAIRLYRRMRESTNVNPDSFIYRAVVKACAIAGDLVAGKVVHADFLASLGEPDLFVQTGLVSMYAKCGSLEDARRVFDKLSQKDVVSWNAMLAGYAQQGMGEEALSLYNCMRQQEGSPPPNSVTFVCLLQACASVGVRALYQGKRIHAYIENRGLQHNVVLGGSLVNMYAKCGSLEDARTVFDILPERNVITWTALITGYVDQGMGEEALRLHSRMQQEGITPPNSVTYVCLLQACASVGVGALDQGKEIHGQIAERGLQNDVVLGGSLVNMYAQCGSLEDARSVFDKLPKKHVVTWTALIAGYAGQGMGQESLSLYTCMRQDDLNPPDSVVFLCLLQACASVGVGALDQGKRLHVDIKEQGLQDDVDLGASLVNMYAKCGSIEDARSVFDRLPDRNVVTWTSMIAGYSQQEMGVESLSLYICMEREGVTPNSVTYVCLLHACASVGVQALDQGKRLHAQIEERGLQDEVVLGGSLANMYAKCSSLQDARSLFDRLPVRNVLTWNVILAGYATQGFGQEALCLYSSMQEETITPNSVTFICLLQACAIVGVEALVQGKQLHSQIEERGLLVDVVLGTCLIEMYAKCGSLKEAHSVFDRLSGRNVITWTVMFAAYVQHGMGQEALTLYSIMEKEGITHPNSVTFVCLLQACAIVAALPMGQKLHVQIEERGLQTDPVVGSALVNMYAKCGSMFESQQVFDSLPERTIEAWNALMGGYSRQGDADVVFYLVNRMRQEGIQPDSITFLSVLTVCSHVGLVDKGRKCFDIMRTEYSISPSVEHYTCMLDLLGRAGHLDEALQIAESMPFPPSAAVWLTLLGACQKWKNVNIGQQAFEGAVNVDRHSAAAYVLMSNIYASTEMWEESKGDGGREREIGGMVNAQQSQGRAVDWLAAE